MAESNASGFWGNMARCRQGSFMASAFLVVIAGSLFPDVDILWKHRSWTHDWRLPMAVLCLLAVAYLGGLIWAGVLKWKR